MGYGRVVTEPRESPEEIARQWPGILGGRTTEIALPPRHEILAQTFAQPLPPGAEVIYLAMGCFWGSEELYWQTPGVITTAVGYAGGLTLNPTYEETCTGRTGHTETVAVAYDPQLVSTEKILAIFWENHDPTQVNRQGNDLGTQYRSALFVTTEEQLALAQRGAQALAPGLAEAGYGRVTTEIVPLDQTPSGEIYWAEEQHQQYLAKRPHGYRCHSATGVRVPALTA